MSVSIRVSTGSSGVSSIEAFGHTCLAPRGQDLACSAVSALLECLASGAERAGGTVTRGDGFVRIIGPDPDGPPDLESDPVPDPAQARQGYSFLATAVLGTLREIAREYPGSLVFEAPGKFSDLLGIKRHTSETGGIGNGP